MTLLDLSYNRLEHLPAGFGNLRPSELNLSHNCLETGDPYLLEFLEMKDPDWQETQTVAPTNLQAAPGAPDGLDLSWTPISYTLDGGYYEISYAENPAGPYTVHGTTPDKAASSYHLDGLDAGTLYTLRVRTYTPAHGDQQNELWSSYNQVSAGFIQASPGLSQTLAYTYSGGGEVTIDIPANALTETTNVVVTLLDDLTPPDAMRFSGYGFTLQAFSAGEAPVALNWTEPFSLTIRYTPADMNGLDEAGLTLLSWDGSAWVENACGTATLLPDANQFTAPLCAPGQFGLFAPQSDYHVFLPMLSK